MQGPGGEVAGRVLGLDDDGALRLRGAPTAASPAIVAGEVTRRAGATGTDAVLLAVDVGNTHTVIGTYQGDRLERHWRLRTDHERTADEYGVLLLRPLRGRGRPASPRSRASSSRASCRRSTRRVDELGAEVLRQAAAVRRPGRADRHADPLRQPARGRRRPHRQRGRRLRAHARRVHRRRLRHRHHLRLREPARRVRRRRDRARASASRSTRSTRAPPSCTPVELVRPPRVVGRNTVHAIQSGVIHGYTALVDGVVERIRARERRGSTDARDRRARGPDRARRRPPSRPSTSS